VTISGTTRVVVVIGDPVEHSRSPVMLNAAFAATGLDMVMVPLRVRPADLVTAVRGLAAAGVVGASVTVPHKAAVVETCTRLTEAATAIRAVNCLVFEPDGEVDGEIVGDNTDGPGFVEALTADAPSVFTGGRRAVILGAGGAACAVEVALVAAGVRTTVIARRPDAAALRQGSGQACRTVVGWDPATLERELATADLLVDCTPVGLDPSGEPAFVDALPLARLLPTAVVASLIYHRDPLLLTRARDLGHRVLDGRGMLVHQGARAFSRWTGGRPAPIEIMKQALDSSLIQH
jgi:shikimate dehydrogenase